MIEKIKKQTIYGNSIYVAAINEMGANANIEKIELKKLERFFDEIKKQNIVNSEGDSLSYTFSQAFSYIASQYRLVDFVEMGGKLYIEEIESRLKSLKPKEISYETRAVYCDNELVTNMFESFEEIGQIVDFVESEEKAKVEDKGQSFV